MFFPSLFRFWMTQSIPAISCETSVRPSASATLTLTTRASGATPTKLPDVPLVTFDGASESRPAMMPAMWVPCP